MFNPELHSLSCRGASATRTSKHDKVAFEFATRGGPVRLMCDSPMLEPSSRNPSSNARPDIEFRTTNDATAVGYDVVEIDSYNCADVTIIGIPKSLVTNRVSVPVGATADIWNDAYNDKVKDHTKGTQKCMPLCVSVLGAIEPRAGAFIHACKANSTHPDKDKFNTNRFISRIVATIWKYNSYMYEAMWSRTSNIMGLPMPAPRL